MPGAGKSTVAHLLADLRRSRGDTVWEPTWEDATGRAPCARRLRKLRIAAAELPAGGRPAVNAALSIFRLARTSFWERFATALNWLYVKGLCRRARGREGITVLDQGVLQAVWSVALRTDSLDGLSPDSWAALVGACLPPDSALVFLEVGDVEIRSRLHLRTRGGGRVDAALATSEESFRQSLERGREALAFVERVAGAVGADVGHRVVRLDGGTTDPRTLARHLSKILG